jgi:hypothetical protein
MRSIVNVLLAAACVVYAPASLAQSPLIAMRKASSDLTTSYLQAWSAPQAASPAYVARVYAPRVSFYGRTFDRVALSARNDASSGVGLCASTPCVPEAHA